jgi:hypothetical protein
LASLKTDVWNVVLALATFREGGLHPCGTGFLVGRSLALTASHVVEPPCDRRAHGQAELETSDFSVVALQRVHMRPDGLCWRVQSLHRFPVPSMDEDDDRAVDVTLLKLAPLPPLVPELEDFRRWFVEINVAPPSVGSNVTAYGFARSKIEVDQADPVTFVCSNAYRIVQGKVSQVFFPRRDRGMLAFPCFEIEGDFEPGMSGGPIFNDQNQVCGVVSSGGIPGVCYGAVLWPLLEVEIDGLRLLDLARQGRIRAANHHCVSVHPAQGYDFPGMSFDPNLVRL